jgi:hypothetical protein
MGGYEGHEFLERDSSHVQQKNSSRSSSSDGLLMMMQLT